MRTNVALRRSATGIIAACLGLAAGLASAQDPGSRATREFAQAAASSDQFEILAAETALTQSTNAEVRSFAARMLQDHQQLGQSVRDAAARSGLKPPEMAMSADQAQWLAALQSVNGHAFDTLYLGQQMLAHRSALEVEQSYAKSGDDSNLRRLAASAAPLVATHADMAKQAVMQLGSP